MTEMTRTFGLELMESVLTAFPTVFLKVNISKDHFTLPNGRQTLIIRPLTLGWPDLVYGINLNAPFPYSDSDRDASPLLSLSSFPYSDSLLNYIGIAIAITKKWVQNPLVSDIAIANTQWKWSHWSTYNLLLVCCCRNRDHCMETGRNNSLKSKKKVTSGNKISIFTVWSCPSGLDTQTWPRYG